MKAKFRTYVWRCLSCGTETDTKPKGFRCRCGKVCVQQRPPRMMEEAMLDAGLPSPVCEYGFHPARRWEFDWVFQDGCGKNIAVEVEGGIWSKGRHVRGKGFKSDMEKYNEAAILGWKILRFTPQEITSGVFLDTLKRAWEAA